MKINFIGLIVPLCILIPILVAIVKWRSLPSTAKCIFWYLVAAGSIGFAALIIGKYFHTNNMPLVHILTAVEIIIFTWYYSILLQTKRQKFYMLIACGFVLLCILNAIFLQSIYTYSSYTRSVEAIICILLALNYFAGLASGNQAGRLATQPDFYFNAGIFLYFSGAFILFIFSNFIIANLSKSNFFIIWNIHGVLVLLMYILFSVGFSLCKK